ncbi:hypothetical protein BKA70DRAFT_1182223 [Coprinopsis sp. MPI-PUGE-AT-0042]|nr:hypothetical protein BKA70DRAFT_1182223 [Coprinopsis sp. MPI-PUGE-AT-0042]
MNNSQSLASVEDVKGQPSAYDGEYHAGFCDDDADIILASKDCKVLFRTHSYTLKRTSGFFRSMFTLPYSKSCSEVIYTNDEAIVLEHLLRMVGGLPLLPITGDVVESLLHAAEAYEMPGPISIIRLAVTSSPLADDSLRMYTICSRYEWEEELRFFSTRSLVFNLHDSSHFDVLQRLSSHALLRLFAFHRSRRERLRSRLNEPPFVTGGAAVCIQCQARIEYQTWRELKYRIIFEIDERPLGDTIGHGLNLWPEAIACWQAHCPNTQCQRRLYDKSESFRAIQQCIDELPLTV